MQTRMLLASLLALVLVGCSDKTKTRAYDISVKNDTGGPITVWLTKDGPPVESGWRSPEQLAMVTPGQDERISGLVVAPGKLAETGTIEGKFQPGAYAWLRVYDGQKRFSEILAVGRDSPGRIDLPLTPGKNSIVVKKTAGHLVAAPVVPEAAPVAPRK